MESSASPKTLLSYSDIANDSTGPGIQVEEIGFSAVQNLGSFI